MMLNGLVENTFVNMAGWSLLHSLWQIPIIAGLLLMAMIAMRRSSANSRYIVSLFALILAFAAPVLTVQLRSSHNDLVRPASRPEAASSTVGDEQQQIILTRRLNGQDEKRAATDATTSASALLGQKLTKTLPAILPWIVILWLTGVFVYTVRLCRGFNSAQAIRRGGSTDVSTQW
ncbi:MAG: hypothetical protein QOH96_3027, partial [Blastocatellia bacterium]|nr:hypothetical protein [Blastocatellia bacterium]